MSADERTSLLRNEFAAVEVEPVRRDGRERLRVRSPMREVEVYFDPLELELLATLPHRHIRRLLAGLIEAPEEYLEADRHER